MKATKSVFEEACELYNSIGKLAQNGVTIDDDTTGTYECYNSLVEKYDFNNRIISNSNGRQGVDWSYGEAMIPTKYDEIKFFTLHSVPREECFAIASCGGREYLLNNLGEEVFSADELRPNLAAITPVLFRANGKWGLANRRGEVVIEAKYDKLSSDVNGIYWLSLDGKEGMITPEGYIVDPIFDSIELEEDKPIVFYKGQKGYLDENLEFTGNIDDSISFEN